MVRLDPYAQWRVSKRGLLLAGRHGEVVLLEHPRAAALPGILADDPDPTELVSRLGPPQQAGLVEELVAQGMLVDTAGADPGRPEDPSPGTTRFRVTRSGVMIAGIEHPAAWLDAHLVPLLIHPAGRVVALLVTVAGVVALLSGRPDLPAVSNTPGVEVMLMIVIGTAAAICHELAHAVAMVHYGRAPRRAGFGFYWGAVSFFVDSTPTLTLPRRARVTQALVGLGVDVVTTAGFAIAAHLVASTLWAVVFWRLAVLACVDILINLAPVLEVDGHWALADWLDEPDLAPRARRALGAALGGSAPRQDRWLAWYGAASLLTGVGLLVVLATVFWANAGELVVNLFAGNPADIALGVYFVAPVVLGVLFSGVGLIAEIAAAGRPADRGAPS